MHTGSEQLLQEVLIHHFIRAYENGDGLMLPVEQVKIAISHIYQKRPDFIFDKNELTEILESVEEAVISRANTVGYSKENALAAYSQVRELIKSTII